MREGGREEERGRGGRERETEREGKGMEGTAQTCILPFLSG